MKTLVSVIVPAYNVESYMKECLESIVNQSYPDIEIVILDDGSFDNTGIIMDEFANKDCRLTIIHKYNEGQAVARNLGLDIVTGEYIMFIDSDDWVEPDFIKIPLNTAINNNADLVIFEFWHHNGKNTTESLSLDEGITTNKTAMSMIHHGAGMAVWNKCYKKSLIENIRFPAGKTTEDQIFTPQVIHKATKIYCIPNILYHYRYRDGSTVTLKSKKRFLDKYELIFERARLLESWGGYESEVEEAWMIGSWGYLIRIGNDGSYSKVSRDYITQLSHMPSLYPSYAKLLIGVLKLSPRLFDFLCIVTGKRAK